MSDVLHLLVLKGRSDLEHDIRVGQQSFARRKRGARFLVILVQKLCVRPGVVFDEHLCEAFLAEKSNVLWGECDAAFVRIQFSRNTHSQRRVGSTWKWVYNVLDRGGMTPEDLLGSASAEALGVAPSRTRLDT